MKTQNNRGYDDSHYLEQMAVGIITRKYSSVLEAARSVLNEEGGSNVDRLRRKYRQEKWLERALEGRLEHAIDHSREEPQVLSFREMVMDFLEAVAIPYKTPRRFFKGVFMSQYLNSSASKALTISAFIALLPIVALARDEGIGLVWLLTSSASLFLAHIFLGYASEIHRDCSEIEPEFYVKW